MRLIERLQAKLELRRLEKRYTRREKRAGFTSDTIYVDGEYMTPSQIWNKRNNSDSSTYTSSSSGTYYSNVSNTSSTRQHYTDRATGIGYVHHGNNHHHDQHAGRANRMGVASTNGVRKAISNSSLKPSYVRSFEEERGAYGYEYVAPSAVGYPKARETAAGGEGLDGVPEDEERERQMEERRTWNEKNGHADEDGVVLGYGRGGRARKWRQSTIW
ncbi:MAG: hypothetical protein Q9169_008528 [Polycauliona sp. 2 TL-2023]